MFYILYGKDKSMVSLKKRAIQIKHHIEDCILEFDATKDDCSLVLSEMDSMSIFDENKLIILENATFLSSKNTTNYEIQPFLSRKDSDCIVIFICPSDKLDSRKKMVKELSSCSTLYACISLDEKSQKIYLQDKLKEYKVKVDFKTLDWMSARIGLDPLCIENEVKKLSIYSLNPELDDVKALMSIEPMNDVFKMVDAFFNQNGILLMAYYRNFMKLNMTTPAIVGLLASQIRFLFQVRVLMDEGYTKEKIASSLKAHPYRVQINMQKAMRFTSEYLLESLSVLSSFDQSMKLGKVDKDEGFEQFCLNLTLKKEVM